MKISLLELAWWRSGSIKLATDPDNSHSLPLLQQEIPHNRCDLSWGGDRGNGKSNGIKNKKIKNEKNTATVHRLAAHFCQRYEAIEQVSFTTLPLTPSPSVATEPATTAATATGGIASDCSWHSKQTSSGRKLTSTLPLQFAFDVAADFGHGTVAETVAEGRRNMCRIWLNR